MKKILALIKKKSFYFILILFALILFYPLFLKGHVPLSSNLLASFFNPFAKETFKGWEQGIPNKPVGMDDLRIFYPQRLFTMQQLRQGNLPFWDPYTFSGNFHIGLSETAVFYPLNLIFFFFPQIVSWVILMFSEPLLAGIGMYLFLRKLFKEKYPAFFGGIVFSFSGVVIVRMVEGLSVGQSLIWFPFAFWAVESFFQTKKFRYIFMLLGSFCFSLLAGWFQFTFYILLFSFIYCLFRFISSQKAEKRFLPTIFLPFIALPLITGFHLLASVMAFLNSPREVFNSNLLSLHLMPIAHILTLIFPDFWGNPGSYNFFGISEYKESIIYVGAVPFVISLFSFFLLKTKEKATILFFTLASIFALILGTDNVIAHLAISLPIPVISSFLPNRVFVIASFSLCVLSAYGINFILNLKLSFKQIFLVFTAVFTVLILTPIGVFYYHFQRIQKPLDYNTSQTLQHLKIDKIFLVQEKNLIVPAIFILIFFFIIIFFKKTRRRIILFSVILVLVFAGQFYFAKKYIPWSQVQFIFPNNSVFSYLQRNSGINRFVSTRDGYIQSDIPLFYNLYTPDGVGSMYIARYGELVSFAKQEGKFLNNIPRIEIRIDPQAIDLLSGDNKYLLRFFQIDGVKYILRLKSEKAKIDKNLFEKVWEDTKWEIYVYKQTLPRIFFTSNFFVDKSSKSLLNKIFSVSDPKQIGLEEYPGFNSQVSSGNVLISTYKPGKIILDIDSSTNGLVYVSDNFVKEWKATIDGIGTKVYRANYSFMAVPVPSGKHVVVFTYVEKGENIAFMVSGATILALILLAFYLSKTKKIKF